MTTEEPSRPKFIPKRFTLEELEEADRHMRGLCLGCGAARENCEPDARRYRCDSCGQNLVYGAEEIMLRGYVKT